MHIAINTRFLLPNRLEGMGWVIWEFTRRWIEQHPEHQFSLLFDRPYDAQFVPALPNVQAHVVSPPARHPLLWYLWYEWAVPRKLRQIKADAFVSPDNFCSLRSPCPTLLVVHDLAYAHLQGVSGLTQRYYEHFMPRYAQRAQAIATVSDFSKQDIENQFNISPDKVFRIYPGANTSYRVLSANEQAKTQAQYSDGQPYFLYLGSIHPRKNLLRLLQAFEQFKEKNQAPHQLLLVGRMAWQTGEVGEILQNMKHRESVRALGYVEQAALPQIVGAAHALCYVSLFEGFGIPILEGISAGVPVLCSRVSSMPEVGGEAALYVNPENVNEIAQGLEKLALDADLQAHLRAQGPLQAQKFSWNLFAQGLWDVLDTQILKKI